MNAPFAVTAERVRLADLRQPDEAARIEGFVAEMGGSVFQRPAWLQAIERGTGQRARGLVAERAGAITGWLPLSEVHSPLFGRMLASSGFAVGGGVLADHAHTALMLCRAAEEQAQRLSCSTIELRGGLAPAEWTTRTDSHCGFVAPLATDDENQLLAIPRKQRAEVRKGLENNLTVTVGTSEEDRRAHYAVYAESVRNLGTPVFPRALFDAVLNALEADILTVRHQGKPVASVLSLYHDAAVLPYWGGGTAAARPLRANDRMYFELMRHARERGCTRFDFGRSKVGTGAAAFKKNWGFDAQPLTYWLRTEDGVAPRSINPLSPKFRLQVAAWQKLPLPLANLIGPWIARGLG